MRMKSIACKERILRIENLHRLEHKEHGIQNKCFIVYNNTTEIKFTKVFHLLGA